MNPFEWELNEHTASEEQEPDVVASQKAQPEDKVARKCSSFGQFDVIGSGAGEGGTLLITLIVGPCGEKWFQVCIFGDKWFQRKPVKTPNALLKPFVPTTCKVSRKISFQAGPRGELGPILCEPLAENSL